MDLGAAAVNNSKEEGEESEVANVSSGLADEMGVSGRESGSLSRDFLLVGLLGSSGTGMEIAFDREIA